MQLAKSAAAAGVSDAGRIRVAGRDDAGAIMRLLRQGAHRHVHVDWHAPGDWLGLPSFLVLEQPASAGRSMHRLGLTAESELLAVLAVAADPLPAAWVRLAATRSAEAFGQLSALHAAVLDSLEPGVDEIAWFLTDDWPESWLERLGFRCASQVITLAKRGGDLTDYSSPAGLKIRPVELNELTVLADMEVAAFEPRWRHSAKALRLAWQKSISFDVAELDGEPVGFQFSTGGRLGAHLARMTVRPEQQGRGIGAALLANALTGYRLRSGGQVTLNTQADNVASLRLYGRFGFQPTGLSFPVWSMSTVDLNHESEGTDNGT